MRKLPKTLWVAWAALLVAGVAWAGSSIRKNGSIVAEFDGAYIRQNGSILAQFDGMYLRQAGSIVAERDGRYIRQRGSIVAEMDGNYIRQNGSIVWVIEENGTVRKRGTLFYTVEGYTGSEEMRWRVAAFLLFFAT